MRIALISDLHGNRVSLDAVLRDIADAGVDRIACLGDVATLGPRPREVIAWLRDSGCPCIMGNHDEFLLDAQLICGYTEAPVIVESVDWCRDQLDADDLAFVASFERTMTVELSAETSLLLFHGSPRSHMEDLLATTSDASLDALFADRCEQVFAGGHTHMQLLRRHRGAYFVNPGSLGLPFREIVEGRPRIGDGAEYAIVDASRGQISVELRRVAVSKALLRAEVESSALPLAQMLLAEYGHAAPTSR